jgi:hypothetical protein
MLVSSDASEMEGLSKLSEFGLLGSLLAISLAAIIWLYGRQNSLWGERLGDWRASQEIQQAMTVKINELATTSEQRTRAQEEAARALQLMSQSHAQQGSEIARLREEVAGLRQEMQKLHAICSKWESK